MGQAMETTCPHGSFIRHEFLGFVIQCHVTSLLQQTTDKLLCNVSSLNLHFLRSKWGKHRPPLPASRNMYVPCLVATGTHLFISLPPRVVHQEVIRKQAQVCGPHPSPTFQGITPLPVTPGRQRTARIPRWAATNSTREPGGHLPPSLRLPPTSADPGSADSSPAQPPPMGSWRRTTKSRKKYYPRERKVVTNDTKKTRFFKMFSLVFKNKIYKGKSDNQRMREGEK